MATPTPTKSASTSRKATPQNRKPVSQTTATNAAANAASTSTAPVKSPLSALLAQAEDAPSFPATKVDPELQSFAEAMIGAGYIIKNLPKNDATESLMSQLRQYGNARNDPNTGRPDPKKFKVRTTPDRIFFRFLNEAPTKRTDEN